MNKDIAISVENLSKAYKVRRARQERYVALRDVLANGVRDFIQGKFRDSSFVNSREPFWALRDVSFEVKRGEVVGIIGRNGAGKSTLLKILSRVAEPTSGKVTLRGRAAALLEVGTGFHPELTGRENIFLSGAILGMSRREIRGKFDEIVAFSGVEEFIDTPVKRYSSGMYVRLGFAVAAHLDPEILLVDEVLAVGDAEFQKKCLGKMEEVASDGRTVLFVSHNLGLIRDFCERCMHLEGGRVGCVGEVNEVVDNYLSALKKNSLWKEIRMRGILGDKALLRSVTINSRAALQGEVIVLSAHDPIEIIVKFKIGFSKPLRLNIGIFKDGVRVFTLQDVERPINAKDEISAYFMIPARLLRPGIFSLGCGGLVHDKFGDWFWADDVCSFQIADNWGKGVEYINHGIINLYTESGRIPNN
ncbi:MAG: ATP-binding cassette domain-containing protein [Phaeodactylibacter sp.]|nr:ATP-binding cassette domain-containing protein [Phaeodactylibacter sp.]